MKINNNNMINRILERLSPKYRELAFKDFYSWSSPIDTELKYIFEGKTEIEQYKRAEKLAKKRLKAKEFEQVKDKILTDINSLKGLEGFNLNKAIKLLIQYWVNGWCSEAVYKSRDLYENN